MELFCYCKTPWDGMANVIRYVSLFRCDGCSDWFHGDCLSPPIESTGASIYLNLSTLIAIQCTLIFGPSTETRSLIDYNELNHGTVEDQKKFSKLLSTKRFSPNKFPYVNGETVTSEWVQKTGMREPFIVEEPDGLDMRMPRPDITVDDVANMCGRDRIVEVMEVATQSEKQMTLNEWAEYFATPDDKKKRILNVVLLPLEISGTELANQVIRPKIVRELDWIDHVWPPRTETPDYLKFNYIKWSSSPDQSRIFLADEVKECVQVKLTAGNTMIIPTGWIHSVYTPKDSIVIGGNFLHGLDIGTQLDIFQIENKTGVPLKFRFPYYVKMQWFAAKTYFQLLRAGSRTLSKWELDGLNRLVTFLQEELNSIADESSTSDRKLARANIPKAVKDPQKLLTSLMQSLLKAQFSDTSSKSPFVSLLAGLSSKKGSKKRKMEYEVDDIESNELDQDYADDDGLKSLEDEWNGPADGDESEDMANEDSSNASGQSSGEEETSENGDGGAEGKKRKRANRKRKRFKIPIDFVDDPKDPNYEDMKVAPPKVITTIAALPQPKAFAQSKNVHTSIANIPNPVPKKKLNVFNRLSRAMDKLKRKK
ncbi:hypothetical protein BC829DRAFT_389608 [Chytridium lagenaria]|nr:hypothetical protein BC829DRAFT_389608 [Chytridium lagenaria]